MPISSICPPILESKDGLIDLRLYCPFESRAKLKRSVFPFLHRLTRLRIVELRENHLKTLPKSMGRLIELRRLDIGQNDFIEFPDVIGSLISLTEFWCDYNKLLILPDVSWLVIHGFMGRN